MSQFSRTAFQSLFLLLGSARVAFPFIFTAPGIRVHPTAYRNLRALPFGDFNPNLLEFIYTGNFISDPTQYLFAFLYTQKHLRLVSFDRIQIEQPTPFMKQLMQLVAGLPLPGLDFSSPAIPPDVMGQFIQALGSQTHLVRLGLRFTKIGDDYVDIFVTSLAQLTGLTDLMADGLQCENVEKLATFWRAVASHPTIVACDLPEKDLDFLHVSDDNLPRPFRKLLTSLEEKPRPSVSAQRALVLRNLVKRREQQAEEGDVVLDAPELGWAGFVDGAGSDDDSLDDEWG
jgi:hypothetical protein